MPVLQAERTSEAKPLTFHGRICLFGAMNPVDDQQTDKTKWLKIAVFTGIALLFVAIALNILLYLYADKLFETGHTTETTPIQVQVGRHSLLIPANMMRFANERRGGDQDMVNLYVEWPSLNGYTRRNADLFNTAPAPENLLFIKLSQPDLLAVPAEKLQKIYRRFFITAPREGPEGLVFQSLDPSSGYTQEDVYYAQSENGVFVARCLSDSSELNEGLSPTCLSDLIVGDGLVAELRFKKSALKNWRALSISVIKLVESFEQG